MSCSYRSGDPVIDMLVAQASWPVDEPSEVEKRQAMAEAYEDDEYELRFEEQGDRDPFPWELPGSDQPLTPERMAIFTPDRCPPRQARA